MSKLKKTVLIIGGTSGLGAEIAKLHEQQGWEVHVTGVNDRNEYGDRTHKLNLTSKFFAAPVVEMVERVGEIDRLVWSVGRYHPKAPEEMTTDEILATVQANFSALPVLVSNILRNQLQLESLCVITSVAAVEATSDEALYAGTKAGLSMYARILSQNKLVKQVLEVAPGMMREKSSGAAISRTTVAEHVMEWLVEDQPYARWFAFIGSDGEPAIEKEE